MFCGNCGTKTEDNIQFCPNCGIKLNGAVSWPVKGQTVSVPAIDEKKKQGSVPCGINRKYIAVGAGALVFLIVIIVSVVGLRNEGATVSKDMSAGGGTSYEEDFEEGSAESDERRNDMTVLAGSSDTVLQGEYPNLESISLEGGCLTVEEGMVYPKVTSITCNGIITEGYNGESVPSFEAEAFPALKSVTILAKNSQVNDNTLRTCQTLVLLQDGGFLSEFNVDISHTIEDLYGTWQDENGKLGISFKKDGSVRISEGSGLLGADLFTYSELDDDTLTLAVEGSGLLGMFTVSMDYLLFGDMLKVELAGQSFELYRN